MASFLAFPSLSKPSANKKSGISSLYLLLCGFSFWLFLLFQHETKFHSSNSSMFHQLQLPSPQLHLTCAMCYCTTSMLEQQSLQHYPEKTTTMMEQKSKGADGTWGRSTGKNEKYSDP